MQDIVSLSAGSSLGQLCTCTLHMERDNTTALCFVLGGQQRTLFSQQFEALGSRACTTWHSIFVYIHNSWDDWKPKSVTSMSHVALSAWASRVASRDHRRSGQCSMGVLVSIHPLRSNLTLGSRQAGCVSRERIAAVTPSCRHPASFGPVYPLTVTLQKKATKIALRCDNGDSLLMQCLPVA